MISRRLTLAGLASVGVVGCDTTRPLAPKTKRPEPRRSYELVDLVGLDPTIHLDLRYATANNFTGRVLYSQARAFMQAEAAASLIRAHRRAQVEGYGLTIFDAYRPWRVTKQLWDATEPAKRQYVADPKTGSRHNRGCAVDLTLHRLSDGAAVEMPSAFDDFSKRAHRDFMDVSENAIANRARLARYMEAERFEGRWDEWWHFDFADWMRYPVLDVPFEAL